VVVSERQLEQRPRKVVGTGRESRGLDRRLAELDRVCHPPEHLEGVALDEHHREEQPSLALGSGDRDAAIGVCERRVVVLQVVLRPPEVVEGLQPRRQLRVPQPLHESERDLAVLARGLDLAGGGLAETQRRGGGGDERDIAARARGLECRAAHGHRLLEVQLVDAVHGQLDLQRGAG
jgi:hypothetical protein